MNYLKEKNIVLGVCGGIAAYKTCELVRSLVKKDASVQVVMTRNATRFVTPLTLHTLSGKKVALDQYDLEWESGISHIDIADNADLVIVTPATASFIGKIASGIADNLLSTVIMATRAPVLFCPSMNVNMLGNPAVQENIQKLIKYGYRIIQPGEGYLACGWEGKGRMPEISVIVAEMERALAPKDLSGKKILVTTGPTREHIDPARYISNPSSGKMGFSIAKAAWLRGASVTTISGQTMVDPPDGINNIQVTSASEMYEEVMKHADRNHIIIKTAAVSDYTPVKSSRSKIKKDQDKISLELKKTTDILSELGKNYSGKIIVGFAAETNDIVNHSIKKIREKNIDLIVANNISDRETGFGSDYNRVSIIDRKSNVTEIPLMLKEDVAHRILDSIINLTKIS